MRYTCDPNANIGGRISNVTLGGKPIEAETKYKVANWAPVAEAREPVREIVVRYLRDRKMLRPELIG